MAAASQTTLTRPLAVGDALPAVRRAITREAIDAYRAASGDHNPIHYDDAFAAATRFGGVIAHGMLTLALASEMMAQSYGSDWLTGGSLRVRFRGAAHPGDTLESTGAVAKSEADDSGTVVTCNIEVRNAETGERIITGTATLPTRPASGEVSQG